MADFRRLQHAVALVQDEGLALILIDQAHPTLQAIDHLKADAVIMHPVAYRPAVANADLGSDEPAAEAAWYQIAVFHSRPADTPGTGRLIAETHQHKLLLHLRQLDRRRRLHQHDARSLRRRHLSRHVAGQRLQIAEQVKLHSTRGRCCAFETQGEAMRRDHRQAGRIGRHHQLDGEAKRRGIKTQACLEIGTGKADLCSAYVTRHCGD